MAYQPIEQMRQPPEYLVAAIRTTGTATSVGARIRPVVRDLSSQVSVSWVRTLRQQMSAALVTERLLAGLSVAFGLLALVLAAIGVYGVIAYDVARRTREIGIRMALGAQRRAVLAGVLRQIAFVAIPGVGTGIVLGLLAVSSMRGSTTWASAEKLLFGITPRDPWMLGLTATLLVVVAFAAACLPARRATRVSPSVALRVD
jgi:ABC-type antimicrobial peptide transport system permease subunit